MVATTLWGNACAMSGAPSGPTGGTVERSLSENERSSPSTGSTRRCTYCVRSERPERFSASAGVTDQVFELSGTNASRHRCHLTRHPLPDRALVLVLRAPVGRSRTDRRREHRRAVAGAVG